MRIILLLLCFIWAEELVVEEPKIKELNKKSFKVAKRSGIVIVEFWASWNVDNKITLLDSIEVEDANIYRVMIDTNMDIATSQKISVVPTIVFYDEGTEFKRLQADLTFKMKVTEKDLQKIVDEILMSKF